MFVKINIFYSNIWVYIFYSLRILFFFMVTLFWQCYYIALHIHMYILLGFYQSFLKFISSTRDRTIKQFQEVFRNRIINNIKRYVYRHKNSYLYLKNKHCVFWNFYISKPKQHLIMAGKKERKFLSEFWG